MDSRVDSPEAFIPRICPLCDHIEIEKMLKIGGMTIARCYRCGLGMIIGMRSSASDETNIDLYARHYAEELVASKAGECWKIVLQQTNNLDGVKSVLDIGCGEGAFLDLAKDAGLYTAGIDISPLAVASASQKLHDVHCQSITKELSPVNTKFDIVTMWDVIEHLDEPSRGLRNASELLAPKGRLFVLTPLMGSIYDYLGLLLYRKSGGRFDQLLRMCWDSNHLFRFDRIGLSNTLKDMGFSDIQSYRTLVLSLKPECYAGGQTLLSWTGNRTLDKLFSRCGVYVAKLLHLYNKLVVHAVKD